MLITVGRETAHYCSSETHSIQVLSYAGISADLGVFSSSTGCRVPTADVHSSTQRIRKTVHHVRPTLQVDAWHDDYVVAVHIFIQIHKQSPISCLPSPRHHDRTLDSILKCVGGSHKLVPVSASGKSDGRSPTTSSTPRSIGTVTNTV